MLEQIERRLAERKKEMEMQKKDAAAEASGNMGLDRVPGSKVVAIAVDSEMYAQLQEIAKKHRVRGVRGALVLAAKTGLRHL